MATELLIHISRHLDQFRIREFTAENNILAVVESGIVSFNDGGEDITVNPYEAIFFEKGRFFKRSSITPFSIQFFRFKSDEAIFTSHHVKFENTERIKSTLELLNRLNGSISLQNDFSLKKNLFLDIVNLYKIENADRLTVCAKKDVLIDEAVEYLKNSFHLKVSLPTVSDSLGISYVHFIRRFKAYMGMTPFDYLAGLRLGKAQQLLTSTDMSIKEIAPLCGFDNEYYFSNFFKKHKGISPSQYRSDF